MPSAYRVAWGHRGTAGVRAQLLMLAGLNFVTLALAGTCWASTAAGVWDGNLALSLAASADIHA